MELSRLVELYEDMQKAQQIFEAIGQTNTVNLKPEEMVQLDINYEKAKTAFDLKLKIYKQAISIEASGYKISYVKPGSIEYVK